MRVKSFEKFIDRFFWGLLLVAPMIAYFILSENGTPDLISVLNQFNISDTNLVYSTLVRVFGTGGILPMLNTASVNVVLMYLSYMVIVELCHIVIDVIIFVPRLIVKILDRAVEIGDSKKWKD